MATAFDLSSYPLTVESDLTPTLGTKTDRMSDGTVRIRQVTTSRPVTLSCKVAPLTASQSNQFWIYAAVVAVTELDIIINSVTYRGYINGDTIEHKVNNGLHHWSFQFEGQVV